MRFAYLRVWVSRISTTTLIVGVAASLSVTRILSDGRWGLAIPLLSWGISIAVAAIVVARKYPARRWPTEWRLSPVAQHSLEFAAGAVAIVSAFTLLTTLPITLHNDEANTGLAVAAILEGASSHPLWGTSTFGGHPILQFYVSSLVVRFFRDPLLGLRLASALVGLGVLAGIYCWLRWSGARAAAPIAVLLGSLHHHWIHYSHTGLTNQYAALVTVWALALVERACFRRSAAAAFLSGAVASSGWFVYWSGALVPLFVAARLVVGLWADLSGREFVRLAGFALGGIAFALAPAATSANLQGFFERPSAVLVFSPAARAHVLAVYGTDAPGMVLQRQFVRLIQGILRYGCTQLQYGVRMPFLPPLAAIITAVSFVIALRGKYRWLVSTWAMLLVGTLVICSGLTVDPFVSTRTVAIGAVWTLPVAFLLAALASSRFPRLGTLVAVLLFASIAIPSARTYWEHYRLQTEAAPFEQLIRWLREHRQVKRVHLAVQDPRIEFSHQSFLWLVPDVKTVDGVDEAQLIVSAPGVEPTPGFVRVADFCLSGPTKQCVAELQLRD